MVRSMRRVALLTSAALASAATLFVLLPTPAQAVTITVTNTNDSGAGSLRQALLDATAAGPGSSTVMVPAGTYHLTSGELTFGDATGETLTLIGAGSSSTIIDAGQNSRVLNLDGNLVGGVDATIQGVTIRNGVDSTFGGAGIIGGSANASAADSLTLTNDVLSNNIANAGTTLTNNPGGAVQFIGGSLTVTNSTIVNNGAFSSPGAGIAYAATGTSGVAENLTVSGSTFTGNIAHSDAGLANGGALYVQRAPSATGSMSVATSNFAANSVLATGTGAGHGAAIWQASGTLAVTASTFTGNSASGGSGSNGGAIAVDNGTLALHFNRIVNNSAPSGGGLAVNSATVDATHNWWGCTGGPGTAGCDTVTGSATVNPRLTLTASAAPATVVGPNASSTVTASMLTDTGNAAVAPSNLTAFDGLPITFSDPQPAGASIAPPTASLLNGVATATYSSNAAAGPGHVVATLDNGSATATLTVNLAPAITSAAATTFATGAAGSFTVTTTGFPTAAITETGALPAGVLFTDNGNGTATLAGTPGAGSGGTYPLMFTASNGAGTAATQSFTLTVNGPAAITSASATTFTVGTAGSFTVTTSGFPAATSVSATGTLPTQVNFVDNGDGTATLSGTPAAGTGGTYPLTFAASNGVGAPATQSFTLTVNEAPGITTNPATQTVPPATSVTFTAAAAGFPAPTVQWQVSTDGGTTFTDIPGATNTTLTFVAATTDNGNRYRAVFTNTVGSATTTVAKLSVGTGPAITSAASTTFTVNAPGTFTVTATGIPNATLTTSGTVPSWLTVTDNGNNSATVSGTPPVGSGGTYPFVIHADNGIGAAASQSFVLTVDEPTHLTSADHATFVAGTAGTFTVTAHGGFPAPPSLTSSGSLPTGVTFTDNGNGTATLAGKAAPAAIGSHTLTFTAANGVSPAAVQVFTLTVSAPVVPLPRTPPSHHGTLGGVPHSVHRGQILHVFGAGYHPGAPIRIGFYSSPVQVGTATADATGAFTATITIPKTAAFGSHTLVATGVDPAGAARYLSAHTTVVPPAGGSHGGSTGGTGTTGGTGSTGASPASGPPLAATGVPVDPWINVGRGVAAVVAGSLLLLLGRRRRHARP
jgi:putative Ig domain-containing protein/immunoglobulin I-set domain protein